MSITVGKSVARVDAFDKVTGRTKYYEDRMPAGALYIRIKHAEIAHGFVKSVDTAAAEAIDGVVKVLLDVLEEITLRVSTIDSK